MFRKISENEAESDSDKTENGKIFVSIFFVEIFFGFFCEWAILEAINNILW